MKGRLSENDACLKRNSALINATHHLLIPTCFRPSLDIILRAFFSPRLCFDLEPVMSSAPPAGAPSAPPAVSYNYGGFSTILQGVH